VIYFDWDRNGVPNHIGFVRSKVSTATINTIEGNTSNKVMNKTRPAKYVQAVFRPHFPASFKLAKLTVDGEFGYSSIAGLQKALGITVDGVLGMGTVKALQKMAGVTADGAWSTNTSKAVQRMIGTTADGAFGANSVKALQNWINKKVFP
jgi:lysozyme family protein